MKRSLIILFLLFFSLGICRAIKVPAARANITFFDEELLEILERANVSFVIQDIFNYARNDTIPLLLRYRGFDVKTMKIGEHVERISGITRAIEAILITLDGEIRMKYQYLPFISVEIPRNNIEEFARRVRGAGIDAGFSIVKISRIMLNESVPLTGAPNIWKMKDADEKYVTGQGVRIAIIDTGIDCNHADLDEGKVTGWVDYVDGKTSCYDDHGHGTHVASIAAGTGDASAGKFKGVAPGANLLGVKVCNRGGSCPNDYIIAGIEWSVSNGADVISMSLGGERDPDLEDTVSWAVNNGIVVVVSAGNVGPDYETITSPGVVKEAITVGAVYKRDYSGEHWCDTNPEAGEIVCWSSRGPVKPELHVKPDMTAFGVYICAARASGSYMGDLKCGNDKYTMASGTSMAAPHVSGAAALLLQMHPGWRPATVKHTLITIDAWRHPIPPDFLNVYKYGGSILYRIDYWKIDPPLLVTPSLISLSTDGYTFSKTATVTFKNLGSQKIGVSLDSSADLTNIYNYKVEGEYSSTFPDTCLNPGESVSATMDFSALNMGLFAGEIDLGLYENCDWEKWTEWWIIPPGFTVQGVVHIKPSSPQHFSVDEVKKMTLIAVASKTKYETIKKNVAIGEFDLPTIWPEFDLAIRFKTKESSLKNFRNTYMVKFINLTNKKEIDASFDETKATLVSSNVDSIIDGLDLGAYKYTRIAFRGWVERWGLFGPYEGYHWGIDDTYGAGWDGVMGVKYEGRQPYILYSDVRAQKSVATGEKKLAVLPLIFYSPFDDLSQTITTKNFDLIIADVVRYADEFTLMIRPDVDPDFYSPSSMISGTLPFKFYMYLRDDIPIQHIAYVEYEQSVSPYFRAWNEDPIVEVGTKYAMRPPFKLLTHISERKYYLTFLLRDTDWKVINRYKCPDNTYGLTIYGPDGRIVDEAFCLDFSFDGHDYRGDEEGWYEMVWKEDIDKSRDILMKAKAYYDGRYWSSLCLLKGSVCSFGYPACCADLSCLGGYCKEETAPPPGGGGGGWRLVVRMFGLWINPYILVLTFVVVLTLVMLFLIYLLRRKFIPY
jgi:hypothetical protein